MTGIVRQQPYGLVCIYPTLENVVHRAVKLINAYLPCQSVVEYGAYREHVNANEVLSTTK